MFNFLYFLQSFFLLYQYDKFMLICRSSILHSSFPTNTLGMHGTFRTSLHHQGGKYKYFFLLYNEIIVILKSNYIYRSGNLTLWSSEKMKWTESFTINITKNNLYIFSYLIKSLHPRNQTKDSYVIMCLTTIEYISSLSPHIFY